MMRYKRKRIIALITYVEMKVKINTPVSQTHARSEICVGKGLLRTILRGESWRATFAWGLRGDGSVTKGVCSEPGYGKRCGD